MSENQRLVVERAYNLAVVYLTRNPNLIVTRNDGIKGTDLHVGILQNGRFAGRVFGVEVKASVNEAPFTSRGYHKLPSHMVSIQDFRDTPFPVCLFFFTMMDDKAYFKWIVEPIVEDGKATLRLHEENMLEALDNAQLDELVSRVEEWYDVRSALLV